ncbi:MAG: hypothetical protein D6705_13245 [Deltaproteobacteria bacterium]|nr:MAG: hypothetical protein D6705_13245 [Deltaproteobacteria bacterium]
MSKQRTLRWFGLCLAVGAAGCGPGGSGSGSDGESGGSASATGTSASTSTTSSATSTEGGTASGDSGGTTVASGTGSATGSGTASSSTSGFKFDVGAETGTVGCEQKCGFSEWSYVWLANSGEGTISKINTRTMAEEGRYWTRPDAAGNPSRTSVSIDGKAVVVANRAGGVTKFWQVPSLCEDKNNNNVIDTSTGKNDVLPFDQEECVAWYTAFPEATSQRPVAWTPGTYNPETCEYDDQKVWTAMAKGDGGTWPCSGSDGIWTYLLDGETGAIDAEIHMPDVSCGGTLGPYGAAVNAEGDLWMYIWSAFTIVHVDLQTLQYETIQGGSYGITVDTKGRVWVGDHPRRYDPVTKTWADPIGWPGGAGGAGVAQDLQGRIWTATQGGVAWVDMETMQYGDTVALPEGGLYRGVGVDVDGYIWAVLLGGTTAHRIHPETYEVATYDGLNAPYTYSDFAGGQINNVTCNPAG